MSSGGWGRRSSSVCEVAVADSPPESRTRWGRRRRRPQPRCRYNRGMSREAMSPADVAELVRAQIAGRKSLPNSHRVDLDRCLLWPTRIQVINRLVRDGRLEDLVETVWLVLEVP